MIKRLAYLICFIFSMGLVSAGYGYYGGGFDFYSVEEFLESEWAIFAGAFLLIFAMTFFALSRYFTKREKSWAPWERERKVLENKPIIAVISLVISFFGASAVVRSEWMIKLFGDFVSGFTLIMLLIVLLLLLIPFYKALKVNIGRIPAVIVFVFGLWFMLKYFLDPSRIDFLYDFGFRYEYFDFYDTISSTGVLITALIAGVAYAVVKNGMDENNRRRR